MMVGEGKVGGRAGTEGRYLLPVAQMTWDLLETMPRTPLMTGVVTGQNDVPGGQEVLSIFIKQLQIEYGQDFLDV